MNEELPTKPSDFGIHAMGNGRRFHVRRLGNVWQIYAYGMMHVCECPTEQFARMIADAMEQVANEGDWE
jgi:hypothetical protein